MLSNIIKFERGLISGKEGIMKNFIIFGCVFFMLFMVAPVLAEESEDKKGGHIEWAPEGVTIETTLDGWVYFCIPNRFQFIGIRAYIICPNGAWISGFGNPHAAVYSALGEALNKWRVWKFYKNGVYAGFEAQQ
jgi:hypothetical protein